MDDHRSPIFVPPVPLPPPSPRNRAPDDAAGRAEPVIILPAASEAAASEAAPVFVAPVREPASPVGDEPAPQRPRVGWIVAPVPRDGTHPQALLRQEPVPAAVEPIAVEPIAVEPVVMEPVAVEPVMVTPVEGVQARIAHPTEALLVSPAGDRVGDRAYEPAGEPAIEEGPPRDDEDIAPQARVTRVVEVQPAPVRRSRRWLFWLLLILLVVGVGIWLVTRPATKGAHKGRLQSGAALPVGTATVVTGNMPVTLSALGTVTPLATVTVQSQINGQLLSVGFQEGQIVKKGDFLAQIDPRPYQVALEQAQGTLAKDQASLRDAQIDLIRYRRLVAQNSIATQTLTTQIYLVQQDQGTVLADQAAVDTQKLNLVYCHIVAPVTGRVGLRLVDPGNYVQTTSTTGIVVITQLQPMSVLFNLPQTDLPEVLQRTNAGVKLPVTAYDSSGTTKLATGVFSTFDNQINTTTGTIEGRAIFPNTKFNLFPNQFVNTDLLVNTLQNVDIVPASAIERGSPGTYVYVVQANKTVAVQAVKLGPADGQRQAILSGLKPGQVVVTDGADRLKAGDKITVAPPTAPAATTPAATTPAATTPAATTPAGAAPAATAPSSTAPGATGPGATAAGPASPPATTPAQTIPVPTPPTQTPPNQTPPNQTPPAAPSAAAPPPAATPPGAPGSAMQNVPPAPIAPAAAPPAASGGSTK